MANLLDENGLSTLWSIIKKKITAIVSTQEEQEETLATIEGKNFISYKGSWALGDYLYLDAVTYNGSMYTCVNTSGTSETPGESDDWEESVSAGTDGADGADGVSSHIHIAYSTSSDGADDFSTSYFDGALYMGVLIDSEEEASEDYSEYTWGRFCGTDGTDGEECIQVLYSPSHINITLDSDGNISETLGLEGDASVYVQAFIGSQQAQVTGVTISDTSGCTVATSQSDDALSYEIALDTVSTATRTIGSSSTSLPIASGNFTMSVTISDGTDEYTIDEIKITFSVDYSLWEEAMLSTTIGNISNVVTAITTLTNISAALASSIIDLAEEVVSIGVAAGVDGYDNEEENNTTEIIESITSYKETLTSYAEELADLSNSVQYVQSSGALSNYVYSDDDSLTIA